MTLRGRPSSPSSSSSSLLLAPAARAVIPFDPLLITCCEGLRETEHPLTFVARTAFGQLLDSPGAAEKALPLTGRLVAPLRAALASEDAGAVSAGLAAVRQLSMVVGGALDEYLHVLLIPVRELPNPGRQRFKRGFCLSPLSSFAFAHPNIPLGRLPGAPRPPRPRSPRG